MKVTIDDVAKKAGVSKTTVSRILNGNYKHSKEETRNRILHVIKELDYRPNALAKGLKSMRTNVIGIVLSNLKNPFWTTVLEGVEDTCRSLGYNLMVCNSNEDPKTEEQYIRELRMRQVDGIVINPTVRNIELYQKLVDSKYPLVAINRKIPGVAVQSIVMDNTKGSTLAVQQLLRNGRSKVAACVYHNLNVSTWSERIEGYRTTMLANGFSAGDLRILELDQQPDKAVHMIMEYLREHPDTDAFFSTNNMMTLIIMKAVKEFGLKIPGDIAIVGYDETVWSQHLDPPLTTIMQPGYEMGRLAAKMLIKSVNAKRHPKPETVILEPQMIVRKSCGS